jgi:hypothetical protein
MASREIEKRRRQESRSLKRNRASINIAPTILIVCEGKNTEPSYFNNLKLQSVTLRAVGEGYNTISLVIRAEELAREKHYEEVWCIFDKDDFSAQNFNTAITMAQSKGFKVAYSNQAFEYWILLHFNNHQGGRIDRKEYGNLINRELVPLGAYYDGGGDKNISPKVFNLMFSNDPRLHIPRHMLAIERSKQIYERNNHRSPALEESSTTMHIFLEHLLTFKRY